jgi:creatinine amidohydrolase
MGATEPHNLHLPYGTDTFQVAEIGQRACETAWSRGAKVVLLPTIPYGTETNMAHCSLAMNVNPTTLGFVIRDLIDSLVGNGIHKLVILNGHGGNQFKPLLRELMGRSSMHLFLCDWFRGLSCDIQNEIFEEPGDHAGATETALGLAYFDHLVRKNPDGSLAADEGTVRKTRFEAINQGWISISRPWHLLTTNTGSGNPHSATPDKGQRIMKVMVDRLSSFLVELSDAETDPSFPF